MKWLLAPLFLSSIIVASVLLIDQEQNDKTTHRKSDRIYNTISDWESTNLHIPKDTFLIISTQCTVPQWVEAQFYSLKWVKPKCELIVINDGLTAKNKQAISLICTSLGIKELLFPKEWHKNRTLLFPDTQEPKNENAMTRCADTSQAAYVLLKKHGGKGMLLDGDAAFFNVFDPDIYLKDHYLVGHGQSRDHVYYIWNALILFDFDHMPNQETFNMDSGVIEGKSTDVGGHLYDYLEQNSGKTGYLEWRRHDNIDDCTSKAFKEFYYNAPHGKMMENFENCIAHARNAGNWNNWPQNVFNRRVNMFLDFIYNK